MIKFYETPNYIVAVSVTGTVTKKDVTVAYSKIDAALAANKRIGLMVDLSAFDDATTDAIAEDVKAEFALMKQMKAFARIALVTDKNWLAGLMKMVAGVLPSAETNVFGSADRGKALEWITDLDANATLLHNAITQIPANRDDLLAYDISGRITEDDAESLSQKMHAASDKYGKVDLLVRFTNFKGVELDALFDNDMWSMKTEAFGHVDRYAVVGAPGWMQTIGRSVGSMMKIDMAFFDSNEEQNAWNWLDERKAA